MIVFSLICSYNCFGVVGGSFYVFPNGASSICALVIAPASHLKIIRNAKFVRKSRKNNVNP